MMASAGIHSLARPRRAPPSPCVCFDGWNEDGLASVLKVPAVLCLDEHCATAPEPPPTLGLSLWISTRAAARQDVATAFTEALCQREQWIASRRNDIETALQEAVGNAVIHGSLGIASHLRRSVAGLAKFARAMNSGLADPTLGRQPIMVHAEWTDDRLVVSVEDQGHGFDPSACPLPGPDAPCGRGLCTIRSLCNRMDFDRDGRRITMTFSR